ncbi:hypothetical protein BC835DRAFT_1421336 [Cytidiella melzeri]|nr:hypothetical protein BC835DRAFT_1421336 [Cytidiella melzeri]
MAKHSQHSTVPASAPTSPAVRAHRQLQSSPYTPAASFTSPYTPLSLRSFSTSTASSLATPALTTASRRLSLSLSPEDSFHAKGRKGIADIADNWRNRAHENGIKVGEESCFADDEDDDDDIDLDTSSFFSADRALLPAPFLSTQRRARAFTQALLHVPALPTLRTSQNLSPFLKVPSLPYHSLISILSKIPSDEDSKVFRSGILRDMLYEIAHAAVTALVAKIDGNLFSDWTSLMTQVVRAAMDCQGVSNSVD